MRTLWKLFRPEISKIVSIWTRNMACVPQFDTMHPSMSLGAFFNDRNFLDKRFTLFEIWIK